MQTALRLSNTSTSAKAHDTYADFRRNQHASPRRSIALAAASTPPAASEKEPEKSPSVTYVAVCNRVLFDVQPGRDQCLTLAVSLQLSILAVVVFGVANRVLYKMALVPMGNYVFFLAQLQTFGYVAVYFSILYARYK